MANHVSAFYMLYLIYTCALTADVTGDMSSLEAGRRSGDQADECVYLTDGIPGPPGPQGPFGDHGPSGPRGMDGLPGRDGYPGENRTGIGAKGEMGSFGKPGPMGITGPIGVPGPIGPPGREGLKGPRGQPGENISWEERNGTSDNSGATGLPGPRGEPGVGGRCACSEPDDHDTPTFSAFSVARHSSLQSTDGVEVITWDHVFTNANGDFNPETGIFTCCIPGYYSFTFHVQKTSSSENTMVQLMQNGDHVGSALEYGEVDDEDSTSNSVILHVDYDDQIWLQLYDTTGFYGSPHGYTTFHGYLQYAD